MIRTLLTASAFAFMAVHTPLYAQEHAMHHAAETTDSPLLSLNVSEIVRSTPDRATISTGVTTMAPTAAEAVRANAAQTSAMVAALRRAGIAERDMQTSGFNLSAQYDYSGNDRGQPPRLIGYQVNNQVSVVARDLSRVGALIDALVAAGGNNISGPEFSLEDPAAALDTARTRAMATGATRAALYARAAGYARARLVSVSEGGGYTPPQPMMMARMSADAAGAPETPIQSGEVANGIALTLQYRLER